MKQKNWICNILRILLCLLGIGYAIPVLLAGDMYEVCIRLAIIITAFIPTVLRKVFHVHITPTLEIVYLVFIFLGHFIGSIVGVYNMIAGYDKIVHTISGVLSGFVALLLLKNVDKYNSKSLFFNITFIISFTLAIACCWELFEYACDVFFKADAQHVKATGVNDTMQDMIVALIGGTVVCIMHIYESLKNKKGIIYHLVEE